VSGDWKADAHRLALERRCREAAELVRTKLTRAYGFILLAFDYGAGGALAYASTADRRDTVKALLEWCVRCGGLPASHDAAAVYSVWEGIRLNPRS
jgi:hypothetical protein